MAGISVSGQGLVVGAVVVAALLHLVLVLCPRRWRAWAASRLGKAARSETMPPAVRRIAATAGRAVAPSLGCTGCCGDPQKGAKR